MKPLELYRFADGDGTIFTQVRNGVVAVVHEEETYLPRSIGCSTIEQKSNMERANIEVTMDIDNPVAQRYLKNPIDFVVTLTIFRKTAASTNTWWKGRLIGSTGGSNKKVKLKFESVFTSQRRPGCRARYLRTCRHTHYGRGCLLNPEDWKFPGIIVTAADGLELEVTGIGGEIENRFRGGMIRAPNTVVRFVSSSTTSSILLSRRFEIIEELLVDGPVTVDLYPGCDRTRSPTTGCAFFENTRRFGGFPWIPTKNPMGGSSIV